VRDPRGRRPRGARPEAVEQKIPARCATTLGSFGRDADDPPDRDASEHPIVVDGSPAKPAHRRGVRMHRMTRILRIAPRPLKLYPHEPGSRSEQPQAAEARPERVSVGDSLRSSGPTRWRLVTCNFASVRSTWFRAVKKRTPRRSAISLFDRPSAISRAT